MLHNVSCPSCGGTLAGVGRTRIAECKYCKDRLLVVAKNHIPRYFLSAISKRDAFSSVRAMLRHAALPKKFFLRVKHTEGSLYYVPFYEFYGRRVGMRTMFKEKANADKPVQRGKRIGEIDTEVLLGDFTRYIPAVTLNDWGTEHIKLLKETTAQSLPLVPMDEFSPAVKATVLTPDVSAEQATKRFSSPEELGFLTFDSQVEIAETRLSLIYYPIWIFKYEYAGRTYAAYIDGINGEVLRGRAPRDENRRVMALLVMAGALALPSGKILRTLFEYFQKNKFEPALIVNHGAVVAALVGVFGLFVLLTILAMGWNMFRFSQEIMFLPEGTLTIYIGKPPETWIERLADRLGNSISVNLENAIYRKRPGEPF